MIIGGGPTALGAVHRLYELGIMRSNTQVTILEQASKPGGSATSERDEKGFLWDNMGGHAVFSRYKYFTKVLEKVVPKWNRHVRADYALMKGSDGVRRFILYPMQDKFDQDKSLEGLKKKSAHKKPTNFDEWLVMNFGGELCDVFMRKYNRKFWTVEPKEMNAVWVGERDSVPDVNEIMAKIRSRADQDPEGPNQFFRFPSHGGTGAIWTAITENLPRGLFHFEHKVVSVNMNEKVLQVTWKGQEQHLNYDYLVSTAPLVSLLHMINDTDETSVKMKSLASELVYSHIHVVGFGLKDQPPPFLANKSVIYFPDSDAPFYRVSVFSSFSDDHVPEPGSHWSLMCETAEPMASDNWKRDILLNETDRIWLDHSSSSSLQILSSFRLWLPCSLTGKRRSSGYHPTMAAEEWNLLPW